MALKLTKAASPPPCLDWQRAARLSPLVVTQIVVSEPCMGLALRPNIGIWKYVRICINTLTIEELTTSDYLKFKEGLTEAGVKQCTAHWNSAATYSLLHSSPTRPPRAEALPLFSPSRN